MSRLRSKLDTILGVDVDPAYQEQEMPTPLPRAAYPKDNEAATQSASMPDYSGQFQHLGDRIEEISRAVLTLSVSPDSDQHAFDRIEARLSSFAHSIEQIIESGNGDDTMQDNQAATIDLEPVSLQIERLSEKLDNMSTMGDIGSHIAVDIDAVTQRLDSLQNDFNTLASKLSNNSSSGETDGSFNVASLEPMLADLAARIDKPSTTTEPNASSQGQEILSVLQDLVGKVDNIGNSPTVADTKGFAALEKQLANITAQLGSGITGAQIEMQPFADRLDNIEGQIAASRDIVIDMANQAVDNAAAAAAANVGNAGTSDDKKSDQIAGSLVAIAQRLESLESLVSTSLTKSAANELTSLKEEDTEGETAVKHQNPESADAQQDQTVRPDIRNASAEKIADDLPHEAVSQKSQYGILDDAPTMDLSSADTVLPESGDDDEWVAASGESEGSLTAHGVPLEEVEDVPLAPGSGMPDLEALVRRATKRKIGEISEEKDEGSTTDLIAAARRAAKAASLEAMANAQSSAPQAKSGKKSKLPNMLKKGDAINLPLAGRKKLLMTSAALIVLGAGIYILAPQLVSSFNLPLNKLASSSQVTPVDSTEKTETAETLEKSDATQIEPPAADVAKSDVAKTKVGEQATADFNASKQMLDPVAVAPQERPDNASAPRNEKAEAAITPPAEQTAVAAENLTAPAADMMPPKEVGNAALLFAAANGNGDALFEVGRRYTDGQGVDRSLEEAKKWYEFAAARGHAPSQYRLGNFYEKGHGVKADPATAALWYGKAAEQGNALAMHNLAVLNAMGVIDGNPDMDKAVDLFTKAANLGVKDSQVNLGILYTKGMGVDEDLEAAYKWFAIASRAGDEDAAKKRDTVANSMQPEQLEEARWIAEEWTPSKLDKAANIALVADEWKDGSAKAADISKTEIVREAQSLLSKAGLDPGPADGVFGAKTRDAIISFQTKAGMTADGKITPILLQELSKVSI